MKTNITPELIREALHHIPANMPRDDWARVAMAIKSEYPDNTGLDLFTDWSASADGYDVKATRSTWQSIKAGGGDVCFHALLVNRSGWACGRLISV